MIQCARIAFGLGGAVDPDEAERIVERDITPSADPLPIGNRIEQIKARVKKAKEVVDTHTGEIAHEAPTMTYAQVRDALERAKSDDDRALAVDMIRSVADEAQRAELTELAKLLADAPG